MFSLFGRHRVLAACVAGAFLASAGCSGSNNKPSTPALVTNGGAQTPAAKQVTDGTKLTAGGVAGSKDPASTGKDPASTSKDPAPMVVAAKPVDFEALKALLPEIEGWKRGEPVGEIHSLPVPYASAHARYTGAGTTVIDLEITDSALRQVLLPISIFMATGFDERTEDGHTKAVTMRGSPGYEHWNKTGRTADVTVVVASRFVVRGRGREMAGMDPVRAVVQAVNFQLLGKLR
jgi:hypothetical protein